MDYPVVLKVDYPQRLSRLTTIFRAFTLIPQVIVFAFVSVAGAIVYFLSWWAILFTARYPQTFFNFVTWWLRWMTRLTGYYFLLTDKYPPFSGSKDIAYPIILDIKSPDRLSRLTTFLRLPVVPAYTPDWFTGQWQVTWTGTGWPMTIPHSIILLFLGIAAAILLFLSWWAIVFTAKYPRPFFDFIVWYFRWGTRVGGYTYLVTDKYPPFSGSE